MRAEVTEDRVLVRPTEVVDVSPGGVIIPASAQRRPRMGEVVAVGAGRRFANGTVIPPDPKVGDVVAYTPYGGTEIDVDMEPLVVLLANEVLAIVRPD